MPAVYPWKDKQIEEIVSLYKEGWSTPVIAERYEVDCQVVMSLLKRQGVEIRHGSDAKKSAFKGRRSRKRISEEREKIIVDAYLAGKPGEEAAALAGCSRNTCYNVLQRYGFETRDASLSHRKYAVNEDFFSIIDTEEKAYLLGFIAADGCVMKGNRLSICLAVKDLNHLKMIRELLGSDHIIDIRDLGDFKGKKAGRKIISRLTISSKKIYTDLNKLGIVQRKSLILKPWIGADHLMHHYWRGEFDGDGSFYRGTSSNAGSWVISLHGSRDMVEAFSHFISVKIGYRHAIIHKNDSIFCVKYGGVGLIQEIVKVLYNSATVYLPRKKEIADRILASVPKKCLWKEKEITHNGETLTVAEWAKRLDVLPSAIHRRLRLGFKGESALSEPFVNRVYITYKGETLTAAEWSHITGLDARTIRSRFRKGLAVEEIFRTRDG
jgi:hypothetical protein